MLRIDLFISIGEIGGGLLCNFLGISAAFRILFLMIIYSISFTDGPFTRSCFLRNGGQRMNYMNGGMGRGSGGGGGFNVGGWVEMEMMGWGDLLGSSREVGWSLEFRGIFSCRGKRTLICCGKRTLID